MNKKAPKRSSKPRLQDLLNPENIIEVPQPAPGSYDPNRPVSKNTLLLHQVRHFQLLEQTLPMSFRSGHVHQAIVTEGNAAEYLQKMTAKLHSKKPKPSRAMPATPSRRTNE